MKITLIRVMTVGSLVLAMSNAAHASSIIAYFLHYF
jgi:hypothetical protein